MRFRLDPTKRALVVAGLLVGVSTMAFATSAAYARDFIGVDVGPVSVGIGPNAPDYYAPAPAYVAPSVTYAPPPVVYETPTYSYPAPSYYVAPDTVIVR